jgi:hypothetical protein
MSHSDAGSTKPGSAFASISPISLGRTPSTNRTPIRGPLALPVFSL